MSVTTDDFRKALRAIFEAATNEGKSSIEVTASELHRNLGASQRHVLCCNAMKGYLTNGDEILDTPPSGYGGKLRIRYSLPRVHPQREHAVPVATTPRAPQAPRARARGRLLRDRVDDLIKRFEGCLDLFYSEAVFTGPCVYFHEKTIRIRSGYRIAIATLDDEEFFDALYATLTSWGMHRLGARGAKLRNLQEIRKSFFDLSSDIEKVQHLELWDLPDADVKLIGKNLRAIIEKLKVGANNTMLVPGTKAIHHLLPNLCPPIDRNYTLRFFYDQPQITRNEGIIFEEIFPELHRIARSCRETIARRLNDGHGMSSSQTKIIDNAIVGWIKRQYGKEVAEEEY